MENYEAQARIQSQMNAYGNLLGQLVNVDAKHEAGTLVGDDYIEAVAMRRACAAALSELEEGREVSDEQFAEMLSNAREEAAKPTPLEDARADIDYLLMVGGEM